MQRQTLLRLFFHRAFLLRRRPLLVGVFNNSCPLHHRHYSTPALRCLSWHNINNGLLTMVVASIGFSKSHVLLGGVTFYSCFIVKYGNKLSQLRQTNSSPFAQIINI